MRHKLFFCAAATLLAALLLVACGAPDAQPPTNAAATATGTQTGYVRIDAAAAKGMMEDGQPYVCVDVRTQGEYDAGHIAGAILLPNEDIGNTPPAELPNKDARILVYCRSGRRSAEAANKLLALGYTNVYDFGGIQSWTYGTVIEG